MNNQDSTEFIYQSTNSKESIESRITSFVWQHILLLLSLFLMTLGVALSIRSCLGSSVISSIPMAMMLAGESGLAPNFSIGDYTNLMNILLVIIQILILRKKFEKVQLFQLIIGTIFGWLLDLSMFLTQSIEPVTLLAQSATQVLGCIVLGIAIAFEIRCGSVTMPGEGVPAAISRITNIPFAKAKITIDITLVVIAVSLGYIFFGEWLINVIGPGTLFAMIFVGIVVKFTDKHIGWFNTLLENTPGFKRYIYGLLRFVKR